MPEKNGNGNGFSIKLFSKDIVTVITISISVLGFFFYTKYTVADNTKDLTEVKETITKIKEKINDVEKSTETLKVEIKTEIKNINKNIEKMEQNINEQNKELKTLLTQMLLKMRDD